LNKRIGVLMGGLSSEREISIKSGMAVLKALNEKGYDAIPIDVGRNIAKELKEKHIDVAFLTLHGRYGEDGAIQGMLEMMGIPYTGSGVLSSVITMDKIITKIVLLYHNLPTPKFQVIENGEFSSINIRFPVIVKPSREGSTIGVNIARNHDELVSAYKDAKNYDKRILIEEYIEGKEITLGIIDGNVLPVIEIVPKSGFYNYKSKYTPGMTEYVIPANIGEDIEGIVKNIGLKAYRILYCSGAVRVDFILSKDNIPYILEVNSIPGMTETSLLPKSAKHAGIDFNELVEMMLKGASLKR